MGNDSALASVLESLAKSIEKNTETIEKLAENVASGGSDKKKQSEEEFREKNKVTKVITYHVQEGARVQNKQVWNDVKSFTDKSKAEEYISKNLKGNGRMLQSSKYLAFNDTTDGKDDG